MVKIVLNDPVQKMIDRPASTDDGAVEPAIVELGKCFLQVDVARFELRQERRPCIGAVWPIFLRRQIAPLPVHPADSLLLPRHNMKHELPYRVRVRDRPRRRRVRVDTLEKLLQ